MRAAVVVLFVSGGTSAEAGRLLEMIAQEELDRYSAILRLDEPQRAIAATLYADYVKTRTTGELGERCRDYRQAERDAIAAVSSAQDDPGVAAARIYGELDRELFEVNLLLEMADEEFLAELAALLVGDQVQSMPRVLDARERRKNVNANPKMPGADVDIVSLLYGVVPPGTEPAALDAYLFDFEPEYVSALESREATEYRDASDVYRATSIGWQLEHRALTEPERSRLLDEYTRVRLRYIRNKIAADERIVRLNRQALARLGEIMPVGVSNELSRQYDFAAYPKVFPDPAAADGVVDAALKSADETQLDAISAEADQYKSKHAELSRRMMEATDEFWRLRGLARADDRTDMVAAHDEIIELGTSREQLSDQIVLTIRAILTPEQFAMLPPRPKKPDRPWARP